MKQIIFFGLAVTLAILTGCSSSPQIKTIQNISPDFAGNFSGKSIGYAVSNMVVQEDGSFVATSGTPKNLIGIAETWANTSGLKAYRVTTKEDTILTGGIPLLGYFDLLQKDETTQIPVSTDAIKKALASNEVDCLLLYSSSMLGSSSSVNGFKIAEFGSRMVSSLYGGMSTSASSGRGSSGEAINRTMIYYTCGGEKPLYLVGIQGGAIHNNPEQKVFDLLNEAGKGNASKVENTQSK